MPTLKQYLEAYNAGRKKEHARIQPMQQNFLKPLESKFRIIKTNLMDKVQKQDFDIILGELVEIKEIFTQTVSKLSNEDSSQLKIHSTTSRFTKNKLKPKRMMLDVKQKQNLRNSGISMSFFSRMDGDEQCKLGFTKSTQVSRVTKRRDSDKDKGEGEKKVGKIFFALPPELDIRISEEGQEI